MPNWNKSAKFGISMLLYGVTLLWLLPMITRWPRLAQVVGHVSGAVLIFEMVLIALQAVRGVPMHFNGATPFDAAVAQMAGLAIVFFWLATVVGLELLLFQPRRTPLGGGNQRATATRRVPAPALDRNAVISYSASPLVAITWLYQFAESFGIRC